MHDVSRGVDVDVWILCVPDTCQHIEYNTYDDTIHRRHLIVNLTPEVVGYLQQL